MQLSIATFFENIGSIVEFAIAGGLLLLLLLFSVLTISQVRLLTNFLSTKADGWFIVISWGLLVLVIYTIGWYVFSV